MYKKHFQIEAFLKSSEVITLIEVKATDGSTPRDQGTWMMVSESQIFRTIGGGQLENMAISEARKLLQNPSDPIKMQVPLGPYTGQCCGGTVNLSVRLLDKKAKQDYINLVKLEQEELPQVYIFGAGHVGYALSEALSLLPVHPVLIDTREEELANAPEHIGTRLTALPEQEVRGAKAGSVFVILTHDHALDFLIAQEALTRDDAAYVGMIGSKTKRATFKNWLKREQGTACRIEKLVCPIGNFSLSDKRPEVIAAFAVSEIITHLHQAQIRIKSQDTKLHA